MAGFFTTRRSQWAPGIAVLGASIGIAGAIGLSLSLGNWAGYLGLTIVIALLASWAGARKSTPREPEPPRDRTAPRLEPLESRGKPGYDLEADASTDDQKYLM